MEDECRREVAELHRFFQDWFRGELEDTDAVFGRFDSVMAPEFHIVSPPGEITGRDAIVDRLRRAHGVGAGMTIWVENHRHHLTAGDLAMVMYEEWQTEADQTRGRLSTAVLRRRSDAPNCVEWVHVHETWLPGGPLPGA